MHVDDFQTFLSQRKYIAKAGMALT